jgi:hypothetical protein
MKRSRVVSVGLVPMVASWFASCGQVPPPTHQQICTDARNQVVEDSQCVEQDDRLRAQGGAWTPNGYWQPHGGIAVPMPYHWYFMPYRAGGYPIGYDTYTNTGGARVPAQGGSYFRPAEGAGARVATGHVIRGGFGATWHGVSGGGE